jgi:ABC-2 type transport system ATP-binding protein
LSDRVAILHQGRIVALGTPAALKTEHGPAGGATLEDVFVNLTGNPLRGKFEE